MLTLKYTDFWIPRFVHSAIKIWFSFPSKRFWFLLIPLRKMCSRWQMITLTCFSFEDVCNILHIMYIELYTLVGRKKIKVCSQKEKKKTGHFQEILNHWSQIQVPRRLYLEMKWPDCYSCSTFGSWYQIAILPSPRGSWSPSLVQGKTARRCTIRITICTTPNIQNNNM